MKVKATIRFYNRDVWMSYVEEGEKFQHHFRIPYEDLHVYFSEEAPHDTHERFTPTPLQFLRVGALHSQITGLETGKD